MYIMPGAISYSEFNEQTVLPKVLDANVNQPGMFGAKGGSSKSKSKSKSKGGKSKSSKSKNSKSKGGKSKSRKSHSKK